MAIVIPPRTPSASLDGQSSLNQAAKTAGKVMPPTEGDDRTRLQAEDEAGLAISDGLRIQIRSLASTERHANDVIAMAQTADGALDEMGGLLERMRDLAAQDASGDFGDADRGEARIEFSQLQTQVDRIQKAATYDGCELLGAKEVEVGFDVTLGGGSNDRLAVTLGGLAPLNALGGSPQPSIGPDHGAQWTLGRIDDAIAAVAERRARFSTAVNRFAETAASAQTARARRTAGNSPLENSQAADDLANLCKAQILAQGPSAVSVQANQLPGHTMALLGA